MPIASMAVTALHTSPASIASGSVLRRGNHEMVDFPNKRGEFTRQNGDFTNHGHEPAQHGRITPQSWAISIGNLHDI